MTQLKASNNPLAEVERLLEDILLAGALYHPRFDPGGDMHVLGCNLLAAVRRAIDKVNKPIAQATICQRCGRRDGLDAQVTDEEWAVISGRTDGGGILCLWCMDELAAEKGLDVPVPISAVLHFAGQAIFAESHTIWDEEQLPPLGGGRHAEAPAYRDPR